MTVGRRIFLTGLSTLPLLKFAPLFAEERLKVPSYVPPSRSAPGGRIGGGSRGSQEEIPTILVLAPDHKGLAGSDQPVLYWYVSQPVQGGNVKIEFADVQGEMLFSHALTGDIPRGIHALPLAGENAHLKSGAEYEWKVSFVLPSDSSKTMLSRGLVSYAEAKPGLKRDVGKAKPADLPFLYASAGYWYDSIQAVSELIAQNPSQNSYKMMRAALLDQVRLHDAADFDREAAG